MLERIKEILLYIRYGLKDHPGTNFLIMIVGFSFIAGLQRGSVEMALGLAALQLVVFGSMYLYGAYSGGKIHYREKYKLFDKIRDSDKRN